MNSKRQFSIAAAALLLAAGSAAASSFYVVVPVKGRTVSNEAISVALSGYALPSGLVGIPYNGFNLKSLLSVTGDPAYSGYGVRWSLVSGSLPAGLTLNSDGSIAGTPTADGTASFQVRATYKTRTGEQGYQILVAGIAVGLAAGAPPEAIVGTPYSYDLTPLLSVTGDKGLHRRRRDLVDGVQQSARRPVSDGRWHHRWHAGGWWNRHAHRTGHVPERKGGANLPSGVTGHQREPVLRHAADGQRGHQLLVRLQTSGERERGPRLHTLERVESVQRLLARFQEVRHWLALVDHSIHTVIEVAPEGPQQRVRQLAVHTQA